MSRTILASGRLVAPFKLAVPKGQAWYLVYRPFRQDDAALTAFRDWLMANVKRDPG
jgi:DNA-binding transcriptional LysR family regulator